MDPNLTYPIVLNASINATLISAPSNPLKDWLPLITSIVVVIMGSLITYYITVQIEKQKREYELKKETYFSILDAIVKARQKWIELNDLKRDPFIKDPVQVSQVSREIKRMKNFLIINEIKMKICANSEVYCIFAKALHEVENVEKYMFFDIIFQLLIPAMKDDLTRSKKFLFRENRIKKSWWQLWK